MVIDQQLQDQLKALETAQEPLFPGCHRHPTRKTKYFCALAEAFEAGRLVAVRPGQEGLFQE